MRLPVFARGAAVLDLPQQHCQTILLRLCQHLRIYAPIATKQLLKFSLLHNIKSRVEHSDRLDAGFLSPILLDACVHSSLSWLRGAASGPCQSHLRRRFQGALAQMRLDGWLAAYLTSLGFVLFIMRSPAR